MNRLAYPEAVEGTRGIQLAETEAPDIVILNLDLPGIDAFDVLHEIRLFSDIPIIVLGEEDA